jgi:putative FmdB family regulatory protein
LPIYEYVCKSCDKQFEALVTGDRKPRCPGCHSTRLEQQYSAFAVGAQKGKGRFEKSTPSDGGCGSCGDPRGPGSCSMN